MRAARLEGGSKVYPIGVRQAPEDGLEDLPLLVELSGELDVRYQGVLEGVLDECVASGRFTLIDLSGVTFMDSRCMRELAIQYLLSDGRVVLCDPSREVALSVAACELETCLDFFTTEARHPASERLRLVRGEELVDAGGTTGPGVLSSVSASGMGVETAAAVALGLAGGPRDGRILVTDPVAAPGRSTAYPTP